MLQGLDCQPAASLGVLLITKLGPCATVVVVVFVVDNVDKWIRFA